MHQHSTEPTTTDEKEARILGRLLSTPPDHKRDVKSGTSPKKRGRPPKVVREPHKGIEK
jgi:hypothetical protein